MCITGLSFQAIVNGLYENDVLLFFIDSKKQPRLFEEKLDLGEFVPGENVICVPSFRDFDLLLIGKIDEINPNGLKISVDVNSPGLQRLNYGEEFSVIRYSNFSRNEVYQSMFSSIENEGCNSLLATLLNQNIPNLIDHRNIKDMRYFDDKLNDDQKEAVFNALGANRIFMIEGPAGTGKTRVLCELICQFACRGLKVLACAPNPLALDNMTDKILGKEFISSRIGNVTKASKESSSITMVNLLKKNSAVRAKNQLIEILLRAYEREKEPEFKLRLLEDISKSKVSLTKLSNFLGEVILLHT